MSKVYSIIEFESNIHKEMVVEYLLDGEKAGDLPDIAMWSYHSLSKLAKKVEDMQIDAQRRHGMKQKEMNNA